MYFFKFQNIFIQIFSFWQCRCRWPMAVFLCHGNKWKWSLLVYLSPVLHLVIHPANKIVFFLFLPFYDPKLMMMMMTMMRMMMMMTMIHLVIHPAPKIVFFLHFPSISFWAILSSRDKWEVWWILKNTQMLQSLIHTYFTQRNIS